MTRIGGGSRLNMHNTLSAGGVSVTMHKQTLPLPILRKSLLPLHWSGTLQQLAGIEQEENVEGAAISIQGNSMME